MTGLELPIPPSELPERIRRFADAAAPEPARFMAAQGMVPVKGEELVTLLVQLTHDPTEKVAQAAEKTFGKLPPGVLSAAVSGNLHPAILHALATLLAGRTEMLAQLVDNRETPAPTIERLARTADEALTERIATDQTRLLEHPGIIEALYKNRNTRMSTVDRLVELAARNGVELTGVATFADHVEAIQGQLIPEPEDEPLPGDAIFQEAMAADADEEVIEKDRVDGKEAVKPSFKPLALRIAQMNFQEKLRFALIGNAAARALLIRDPKKQVARAVLKAPDISDGEVAAAASSKMVMVDILRDISKRREWMSNYEIKRALVFNPKTPTDISLKYLSHMRQAELRSLARSKGIPVVLKTMAANRAAKKGG